MAVYVISNNGERLMPTNRYRKVRRLLKGKKAHIVGRKPFTIQLDYDTGSCTQPIELCMDSGYQHIGVSVKTEKQELEAMQYDLLKDEKSRHDDQRRIRHTRRNRLRYRKPRFNNRKSCKPEGWIPPSLKNKADRHFDIAASFVKVAPITDIYFEGGQFDPAVLTAVQEGKPIPEGEDYQHGERYGTATLREAVFQRDHYTCVVCKRNAIRDGVILHAHHMLYWKGRHGNRLQELVTVCTDCHTSANHQPGGKLWELDIKFVNTASATFMNIVKWYIYNRLKELPCTVHLTYGAATKLARSDLLLDKSHINDAYAMGKYHPDARAEEQYFQKRRRNNRILERFYDSKVIDIRAGKAVHGKELGCERTNRKESRTSEKSLRKYRGKVVTKGKRTIRKQRYPIQPGDVMLYGKEKVTAKGTHCCGKSVMFTNGKSVTPNKLKVLYHISGWQQIKKKVRKPFSSP